MPHDQGRANNMKAKVADRRNYSLKKASDKNNVKECQTSELAKQCMEPRWVYLVVSSATPSLQHHRNHCPSKLRAVKSPTSTLSITALGNSPDESRNSVNSISPASSSVAEIFDNSENSMSFDETFHSPSSMSSSNCLISVNSSNLFSENFSEENSYILVDNASKIAKTPKKGIHRKGKKKGKQCNGTGSNKVSPKHDIESEQPNNEASVSEVSTKKFQSYVERGVLDKKSSYKKQVGPFMVANHQNKGNNTNVASSTTLISHTLHNGTENESKLSTACERFVGENFSNGNFMYQRIAFDASGNVSVPSSLINNTEVANYKGNQSSTGNHSALLFESLHDSRNAEINENFSHGVDMNLTIKDDQPILSSDCELVSGSKRLHIKYQKSADVRTVDNDIPVDSCFNASNWPSNVFERSTADERSACSSQATSSSDSHPVISGKKGRRSRKMTEGVNLNDACKSGPSNKHIQFGKENNHFIWQKVEKIDGRSYRSGTNNVVSTSQNDDTSGHCPMQLKSDSVIHPKNSNHRKSGYSYSGGNQTYKKEPNELSSIASRSKIPVHSAVGNTVCTVKSKVSGFSKWINPSSCSESSNGHLRRSNTFENCINENKVSKTSPFVGYRTGTCVGLVSETSCIGPCLSLAEQRISPPVEEAKPRDFCCISVNENLVSPISQMGLSPTGVDLYAHRHNHYLKAGDLKLRIDMHDLAGPYDVYKPQRLLEQSCSEEVMKCTGHTQVQQLTLTEGRNPDCFTTNASKLSDMGKDRHHKSELGGIEARISNSEDNDIVFSSSFSSKDAECSSNVSVGLISQSGSKLDLDEKKFDHHTISSSENTVMREKEDLRFGGDLDKISQTTVCACQFHSVIDGNRQSSGSPASDFEIFLSSASPVLSLSSQNSHVESFSSEKQVTCLFCKNQVPNFTLESLWQWYEEPGCFGLEVKVPEDHNTRLSYNSSSDFNAYFVPYLSAVQLFGNSRSGRCCNSAAAAAVSPNTSSCLDCLPVSTSPACESYEFFDDPLKSTDIGQEVIFEYFEFDQPPWRQPLFEKVKELVSGCPSNSRIFGDPKKLEYLNLHELHHASWYSVAWYPIYRIPDGKFRAAFLTYHSLGQLAQENRPCSSGAIPSVIAPVVGLQTYNDKGESWCQPRSSSELLHAEEGVCPNPPELINERLKRLQNTASVMSRAVVLKDSKTSVNRHPDFEFFLSRSR